MDAYDRAYEEVEKAHRAMKPLSGGITESSMILAQFRAQIAATWALIDIADTLREIKRDGLKKDTSI